MAVRGVHEPGGDFFVSAVAFAGLAPNPCPLPHPLPLPSSAASAGEEGGRAVHTSSSLMCSRLGGTEGGKQGQWTDRQRTQLRQRGTRLHWLPPGDDS